MASTSFGRRYSRSLADGFFAGGAEEEKNFAEKGSWTLVSSMGQVLILG
jgi:hypothetical protein